MPRATTPLPDQAYLRECFDYDPLTGDLLWKRRPRDHFPSDKECNRWNSLMAGKHAGCVYADGYRRAEVNGIRAMVCQIARKMLIGDEPLKIDHENRNRSDDRWSNLRAATESQNRGNSAIMNRNSTGFKGVVPYRGRFQAQICVAGEKSYLGTFGTPEEAHAAYCTAAKERFGEFWCAG
jgi:hypothetical protein